MLLQEHSAKKTSTSTTILCCLKEALDVQEAGKKIFTLDAYGAHLLRISYAFQALRKMLKSYKPQ